MLPRCRYYSASCMTDRLAALELLADEDTPARSAALAHFHDTYRLTPSVLHKWLYVQAASDIEGNVEHVRALMRHASFDITDPAAVSALLGGFSDSMVNFHAENGSGYAFMADAVVEVSVACASQYLRMKVLLHIQVSYSIDCACFG